MDANDHAPILSPVPPLTLPEDTPINGIVAVVTATDEDEGTNAELEYFVMSGNEGGVFSVREDGALQTVAALDYETVTHYELIVEVRDRGNPVLIDSTAIIVMVTDINDNAPSFVNLPSAVQISEVSNNRVACTVTLY